MGRPRYPGALSDLPTLADLPSLGPICPPWAPLIRHPLPPGTSGPPAPRDPGTSDM